MKNLKKMLALMVALVLAFAFAGCEKKEKKDNGAEKTVEGYMEALLDLDFEGAMDFVDEDADVYGELEGQRAGTGVEELDELYMDMAKDMMSAAEYEIKSSEIDGDKATIIVSTNMSPDHSGNGSEKFEKFELKEKTAERQKEIITENYTYEQFTVMSPAEIEKIDIETAIQAYEEVWNEIKNDVIKEIKNADMEEFDFELEKDGENWIIVDIK